MPNPMDNPTSYVYKGSVLTQINGFATIFI